MPIDSRNWWPGYASHTAIIISDGVSAITRFLGIDYGDKRIGIAVSDADERIASPLTMVPVDRFAHQTVQRVLEIAAEYDTGAFVLGLPLNMDGSEGPQARKTRTFGNMLARQSDRPVHYWDERLSSHVADAYLEQAQTPLSKRTGRRDAIAAQIILQGFLDARRAPSQPPPTDTESDSS